VNVPFNAFFYADDKYNNHFYWKSILALPPPIYVNSGYIFAHMGVGVRLGGAEIHFR
jgi:hypothetical protein